MPDYQGSCHCGGVAFDFVAEPIVIGMRCNCSICRRKGAILSNFTLVSEKLNISAADGILSTYKFGTFTAKHYFCRTCGIFTFVQTRLNPGEFRINLGCLDSLDISSLPITHFDGKVL